MGRKTFESIGRKLPNRRNVVISRNKDLTIEGCEIFSSIDDMMENLKDVNEVFIIGGGEIYAQTLPICDKIELTVVDKDYEGDTVFPVINYDEWDVVSEENHKTDAFEYSFSFKTLVRK